MNRIAFYRCIFVHIYGITSTFASSSEYGVYNSAVNHLLEYSSIGGKSVALYTANMGVTTVKDLGGSGNTVAYRADYGGKIIDTSPTSSIAFSLNSSLTISWSLALLSSVIVILTICASILFILSLILYSSLSSLKTSHINYRHKGDFINTLQVCY
jgi:hypothetical protein